MGNHKQRVARLETQITPKAKPLRLIDLPPDERAVRLHAVLERLQEDEKGMTAAEFEAKRAAPASPKVRALLDRINERAKAQGVYQ